jgi:hypothetical protein
MSVGLPRRFPSGSRFDFLGQKLQKQGDMAMKENYGVIWTEEIEIEELEQKIAPSGSWGGYDD